MSTLRKRQTGPRGRRRRNLYELIRPFAHMREMGRDRRPICPDGVCTYQIEIPSSLCRILIALKAGKAYAKPLHLRIDQDGVQQGSLLMITDRNGNGHIFGLDSITLEKMLDTVVPMRKIAAVTIPM